MSICRNKVQRHLQYWRWHYITGWALHILCTCVSVPMASQCAFLSHPPTHNHTVLSLSLHSRSIFYCASLCKTALQAIKIQQATIRSAFLFLLHLSLLSHLFLTAGGWRWSGWTLRRRLLQNCCVDWALSVRTLVRSVCLWEYTSHLLLSSCHFLVMYMFSSTALSMNSRANIFRNLTEKCTCLLHLVHHDKN